MSTYLYCVLAIWDRVSSELDLNGVLSRELRYERDGKRAVTLVEDVDVDVSAIGAADAACYLADTGSAGVNADERLLVDGDSLLSSIYTKKRNVRKH